MMRDIRWNQVIIAFLLGSIVSAGVVHQKKKFFRPDHKHRYERMLDRFSARLKLTEEQKVQVGAIFEAKREKMQALKAETRPRYDEVRKNARAEIRLLLTPDQQVKFDEMEAKGDERRRRWRERGDFR